MYSVYDRHRALRKHMQERGVDACYIPTADGHGSEEIAARFRTREFYSGFTGSAGTLIVTQQSSFLWTDGRYYLQADEELFAAAARTQLFRAGEDGVPTVEAFIREHFAGRTLGFDYQTTTLRDYNQTLKPLLDFGVKLADFDPAEIWENRPPLPQSSLVICGDGAFFGNRLAQIRETVAEGETLLLCSPDEIAWTLGLRGSGEYAPLFYAYLAVRREGATLFTDAHPTQCIAAHFRTLKVTLAPYNEVFAWAKTAENVRTDETVSLALYRLLPKPPRLEASPIRRRKAIKSDDEIKLIRETHMADGLSVTRLLLHLRDGRSFTELSICRDLEIIRRMDGAYLFESFATIAAAGAHGAIVHYQPNEETDAPLKDGLFLLDCGGHYRWGTTDVTRTVALSKPTAEQIRNYTAVLRGHLAVAMATFDETERGDGLDKLARAPLQALGLDYKHGTGHGVGFFLPVHETPPAIRKTPCEPFAAGMVVSDEPGVYLEGQYGIRIENLLLCVKRTDQSLPCAAAHTINAFPCFAGEGGSASALPDEGNSINAFPLSGGRCSRPEARADEGNLCFEPLTYVPYDRNLIDASALSDAERQWVNDYHAEIYRRYLPYLSDWERAELSAACAAI